MNQNQNTTNSDSTQTIRALAREVRNYQLERSWSDARLCKEIPQVGSSKTFKKILNDQDDLEDLNLENQLRNYRGAVETVKILRTKDRPAEPEYHDFNNILESLSAVERSWSEDEECVARLVIIEGATGTGKDAVRRALERRWAAALVTVEATELWRDSLSVPAREIYKALNIVKQADPDTKTTPAIPRYPAEIIAEIIAVLRKRKQILLINEAHHAGPRTLNMIKTLINQTPVVVVMECIPTLLNRLLSANYEEAIQLVGNRLCERVYLRPPQPDEIELLLERRGVKFANPAAIPEACKAISNEAANFGNWRYVCQVARKLFETTRKNPVTTKHVTDATTAVAAMRTRCMRES